MSNSVVAARGCQPQPARRITNWIKSLRCTGLAPAPNWLPAFATYWKIIRMQPRRGVFWGKDCAPAGHPTNHPMTQKHIATSADYCNGWDRLMKRSFAIDAQSLSSLRWQQPITTSAPHYRRVANSRLPRTPTAMQPCYCLHWPRLTSTSATHSRGWGNCPQPQQACKRQ